MALMKSFKTTCVKRISNALFSNIKYFSSSHTNTLNTAEKDTHFGFETVKESEKEKKGINFKVIINKDFHKIIYSS